MLTFESLELFGLVVVGSCVTSMQEKPTSTWQKSLGFCGFWMCYDSRPRCAWLQQKKLKIWKVQDDPRCAWLQHFWNSGVNIRNVFFCKFQSAIIQIYSMWIHVDDSAKPSAHSSISVYKHLFVAGMMIDVESQCGSLIREFWEYIHVACLPILVSLFGCIHRGACFRLSNHCEVRIG